MERSRVSSREFVPGESFPFLGQSYRLRLIESVQSSGEQRFIRFKRASVSKEERNEDVNDGDSYNLVPQSLKGLNTKDKNNKVQSNKDILRLNDGWFELVVGEKERGRKHFIEWYKRNGRVWIEDDLHYYSRRIGVPVPELKVRELGYH